MNKTPEVTLLKKIIKSVKERADKFIKPLIEKLEKKYEGGETTYTEPSPADALEIRKEFARIFKEGITEDLGDKVKNLEEIMANPAWPFIVELIKNQTFDLEDCQFNTFTEKMAFQGYRRQVVEDVISLPGKVVQYYKAIEATEI